MGRFKFSYRDGGYGDNDDSNQNGFCAPGQEFIDVSSAKFVNPLAIQPLASSKKGFTKDEEKILNKYGELATLNPNNETLCDRIVYVFVKIMFEHPLIDGNKRLACKGLLINCGVYGCIINEICESLAKEIR